MSTAEQLDKLQSEVAEIKEALKSHTAPDWLKKIHYDTKQVAVITGEHLVTVTRKCREGKYKCERDAKGYYFTYAQLQQIL